MKLNKWVKSEPLPEQVEAVKKLTENPNLLLGDGTGMGKTYSEVLAFSVLYERDNSFHNLVFCPKSAVVSWKGEIEGRTNFTWVLLDTQVQALDEYVEELEIDWQITVVTYPAIERFPKFLRKLFREKKIVLCGDEGHKCKNPRAYLSKRVRHYSTKSEFIWPMTATPLLNNLEDLWGVFDCFFPNYLGTLQDFQRRYLVRRLKDIWVKGRRRKIWELIGYKNLKELQENISPVILRRSRDLNIKFFKKKIPMEKHEEDRYLRAAAGFLQEAGKNPKDFGARLPDLQLVVDNAADGERNFNEETSVSSKEEAFLEFVRELLEKGEGVIVYNCLRWGLKRLDNILKDSLRGVKIFIISGDTPLEQRSSVQAEHGPGTIILMTEAGGESLNLQRVNNVVFYNVPFSLGHFIQVVGRIARVDSLYDIFKVTLFEQEETIDTYKVERVLHHSSLVSKVLTGKVQNVPKGGRILNSADMQKLRQELLWRYKAWVR